MMPEKLIQFIWANQLLDTKQLETTNGERVVILHQGVLNTVSGPDFERAKVKIGDETHYGAIEIHIDEKNWFDHGHHQDPAYNVVVLHVVLSCSKVALRTDGSEIPTIAIGSLISPKILDQYQNLQHGSAVIPCAHFMLLIDDMTYAQLYSRMLSERLHQRIHWFQEHHKLVSFDWQELIYLAVLRTSGSPHNQDAFVALGRSVPYKLLSKHKTNHVQLEALLLGQANLLNKDDHILNNEYDFLKMKYDLQPIPYLLKQNANRPKASPRNRLIMVAKLIGNEEYGMGSLLQYPERAQLFQAFGIEHQRKNSSNQFIDLLFINAIIPFHFYSAHFKNDEVLREHCINEMHKISPENNKVTRIFQSLERKMDTAAETQAILYLYKTYCTFRRCLECSFGKQILKRSEHE